MRLRGAARYITSGIRSICTQAKETEISQQDRRILLCFNEWSNEKELFNSNLTANWTTERKVVRSFTIPNHKYDIDDPQPEELTVVASKLAVEDRKLHFWTKFGDKILNFDPEFARIEEVTISWLDTSQLHHHPQFEYSSYDGTTEIKDFEDDKRTISWGEIDGKLYVIDDDDIKDYSKRFQVFDPAYGDWQSLDHPPFLLGHHLGFPIPHRALFLQGSRKILGWDRDFQASYCYDVTKYPLGSNSKDFTDPDFGWKRLPYDLSNHGGRPFVIHQRNHPQLGDFNLFLDYYPFAENPLQIHPFYMSDDCQSFEAIKNSSIELPQVCYRYLPDNCPPPDDHYNVGLNVMYGEHSFPVFEFVNLGDDTFGFLLHKHPYYDPIYWPGNKEHDGEPGGVLFLTYKYDIVVVNKAMEIRSSLIGCQHFRYRSQFTPSDGVFMMGAFPI